MRPVDEPSIEALRVMLDELERYFAAEVIESWIFVGLAIVGIVVAALLWRNKDSLWRWAAVPVVAIALIQISVGTTILLRTSRQVGYLKGQLLSSPYAYADAELQRMGAVVDAFDAYKLIEIGLIVVALVLLSRFRGRPRARAVGAGLLVQSTVMLALDLVAEARADRYVEAIEVNIGRPPP